MIAKQQGADGSLLVKFYSDSHTRSLRSKHQRSATFPIPAILSKLPPSMTSFTAPSTAGGDAMMIGEGPQLAILIHPDGSGHAKYVPHINTTCTHPSMHVGTHECTNAFTHTYTHTQHAHTHTHAHTYTHTHTHTHTHAHLESFRLSILLGCILMYYTW